MGTHKQFTVACCFMGNEREASYVWALERITRSLARHPAIAVADNENALIDALALVWPQCQAHLCRWHIAKNTAPNCEKPGMQREAYTVQYLLNIFRYIDFSKIPLRHRFASFTIDQHQHFANTFTSRAEGGHWTSIKYNLRRARGTLLEMYDRIDRSTKQRQHMLEDQIARESVEILTLPSRVFEPVLRMVARYALEIVHNEYKKALHPEGLRVCTQYHEQVMGLPCTHKLMRILHEGAQLSTTGFRPHWRKVGAVADRYPWGAQLIPS